MSINPANLPPEFVALILRQRFRTKFCVECMLNDGVESRVEYYYGHMHDDDGHLVIVGHCENHIQVIADKQKAACLEHNGVGCSGRWRKEYGLEKLSY